MNTNPGRDPTNAASLGKHLKRGGHKEIAKDLDLTEKPDHVPQWCSKHWLNAGDRKGGGKRRRAS